MLLIAGLGNPGKEYENTRHNLGRESLNSFAKSISAPEFHFEKKWKAQISETKMGKEKLLLVAPDTFMNKSGAAIGAAARFFKIKPENIFLIHDDADIALGSTKLVFERGPGGHKGVESVMRALKTKKFWRFRIGISGKRKIEAEKLVLKKFTPAEKQIAAKITKRTNEALETAISEGPEKAMNSYNQ